MAQPVNPKQSMQPCGYQQITTLSTAGGVALTVPVETSARRAPTMALIKCETQAVRYTDDASAPTSTVGFPLAVGETLTYTGNLAALKFIEQAASAKLNVLYYA